MLYAFLYVFLGGIFRIFFRLRGYGQENIPKTGPVVIAGNHISYLDPPMIGAVATRRVNFMAKEELFVPIIGPIFRNLGAFPVKRGGADRAAIKHGIELLENEKVLAIFPEGTRSKTGKLGKLEPGALMMAAKVRAPIVPTAIIGSDIKRAGKIWPKVTVRFGKPICFPEGVPINKELLQKMTDELAESIKALQEEK